MEKRIFDIIGSVDALKAIDGVKSVTARIKSNNHVKVFEVIIESEKEHIHHTVDLNNCKYGRTPAENLYLLYTLIDSIICGNKDFTEMIAGSCTMYA